MYNITRKYFSAFAEKKVKLVAPPTLAIFTCLNGDGLEAFATYLKKNKTEC